MRRTLRFLYLAIEINVILWLAVTGAAFGGGASRSEITTVAWIGTGFAVIIQHWAYYAVYKKAKQMEKTQPG
jgi:hypothetical protein